MIKSLEKVEVKEETKSPTPETAKTDVQIYQEKLIRLERHFSEKVKKLQSKISEFIPEILKTQLDDLLLKFHNEISEEFQKLKNPISGDMAPPATPTPTTPSPKLGKFVNRNSFQISEKILFAV